MTVAALAGRRPDATDSDSDSFPAACIDRVREEIRRVLLEEHIHVLVCSAAAGADLLALQVAQEMGIECNVILPFDKVRFRRTSVIDRGDKWGILYDEIVSEVERSRRLKVITPIEGNDDAFSKTTRMIVSEALAAAFPHKPIAILVWDNKVRTSKDFTHEFKELARDAGLRERVILTR